MKHHKKHVCFIAMILLLSISMTYFYPKSINREISGIMYRAGDVNYSENVKVKISLCFLLYSDK